MRHPAAKIEEHDGVKSDGAELGEENPDIVAPEAFVFVFGAQPALWKERSQSFIMIRRTKLVGIVHTQLASEITKTFLP